MPRVRYYYCNYCERIYSDIEHDLHVSICDNFVETTQEEYQEQNKNDRL